MSFDPLLGPAFPEQGWVPAPRYLMRRARILELGRLLKPGKLLEVGPGAGTLLMEFSARGFQCEALEASEEARGLARELLDSWSFPVGMHAAPQVDWNGAFDTLFAFDVLEHIENDASALSQWHDWLTPGGALLLSVPAKMKLWTAGDEWAGHFRRYEHAPLLDLIEKSGFEIEAFECYGFPLTNFTEKISAGIYRKRIRAGNAGQDGDRRANNDRSGVDRSPHLRIYPVMASLPGRLALRFFMGLQRIFLNTDLGSGYIVRARKKQQHATSDLGGTAHGA